MHSNTIKLIPFLLLLLFAGDAFGQKKMIPQEMAPPSWWVGFEEQDLQVLIKFKAIGEGFISMKEYEGVELKEIHQFSNRDYVALDLILSEEAKPGNLSFDIKIANKSYRLDYELAARKAIDRGIDPSDLIYLIMPDRFANGDPDNDIKIETNERSVNRDSMFHRHGGDLQGIIDHLDYLQDLGMTALWLNPVQENDQPKESYHGYAITDHYAIDPRFGSNELYRSLSDQLHQRDMKLIMDVVYNHIGNEHWLFKSMPEGSWVHEWDAFTRTTYRAPTLLDPYGSKMDQKIFSDGWFDHHMPDLDQTNPFVSKYLIQWSIWWIEYAGLDAFRIDTYAYSDQQFMADLNAAILKEYPDFGIFGETWVHGNTIQGFFTEGDRYQLGLDSKLPGVTDFQLYYGINEMANGQWGWTEGANRVYYTLAKDIVYQDPTKNVVFLDNHDLSRFFSVVGEDLNKFKLGVAFLMTTRGIPMMYYGTEILMKNYADPDGKVREDFPGGWPEDETNKFDRKNLNEREAEAFEYIQALANFRKDAPAIKEGKLMQFIPEEGCYVFFRYTEEQTLMVILNSFEKERKLETDRFQERLKGFSTSTEVTSGQEVSLEEAILIPGRSAMILELR